MTEPIDYTKFTGIKKEIAKKYDVNHDNKLDNKEFSLFNKEWGAYEGSLKAKENSIFVAQRDAIKSYRPVNETGKVIKKAPKALTKKEIVAGLSNKWQKKFPNSPLKQDFYDKLYDLIKKLNCTIKDKDFKPEEYSSKEEQTMDEVIAIFAGEAQLDPKSTKIAYTKDSKTGAKKQITYYGLFQLAEDGLTDVKNLATAPADSALSKRVTNEGIKKEDLKNINKELKISEFVKLSGTQQLDYLLGYMTNSKCYSKLAGKSITPEQFWTMVKLPFQGQNTKEVAKKDQAIENVFDTSHVNRGVEMPYLKIKR